MMSIRINLHPLLLFAIAACVVGTTARAAISIPGIVDPPAPLGVTQVAAPLSVAAGAIEGDLPIIFAEVLGGTLSQALRVDHDGSNIVSAGPAVDPNSVVNNALVAAILPSGTKYNSYLFHFDPLVTDTKPTYISTITFTERVIGVQLFSAGYTTLLKPFGTGYTGTLEGGDTAISNARSAVGDTAISFPTGVSFRGLEEDEFALVISNNTVSLMGRASALEGQFDQIRIFTAAVPEPTTFAVWGLISLAFGCFTYRRRGAKAATA